MPLCRSVVAPGTLPLTFTPDIKTPPELASATPDRVKEFWRTAARIAMEVKQRELSLGLDHAGRKLRPVRARKLRYRSGKVLDGDPLMPHRAMSRTRRLLRTITMGVKVTFYWAMGWGRILDYHRRGAVLKRGGRCVGRLPVRNVFGISPKGRAEISQRAIEAWRRGFVPPVRSELTTNGGTVVAIPFDPALKRPRTQADWAKLGVKTMQYDYTSSVANPGTGLAKGGPAVATGPGTGLFIGTNFNRRKKR
jgi:hypothetical protein